MLTVITGPMFSGKTSRLLSLSRANSIAEKQVAHFKTSNDKRYHGNEEIVTHDGKRVLANVLPIFTPEKCLAFLEFVDVFVFDEAQFFVGDKFISVVEDLLYKHGKQVIVAGLSQDSSGKPFGAMPYLLAIADDIIHLKAVCSKSKIIGSATRTYRKDVGNNEQVAVGGSEMYEPRSFKEWLRDKKISL